MQHQNVSQKPTTEPVRNSNNLVVTKNRSPMEKLRVVRMIVDITAQACQHRLPDGMQKYKEKNIARRIATGEDRQGFRCDRVPSIHVKIAPKCNIKLNNANCVFTIELMCPEYGLLCVLLMSIAIINKK